jgi:AcrR family transcriptional regulator
MRKQRVSKDQWLHVALKELEFGGVEAVRVDVLAKRLSVSRSGFYWHFRNREDLWLQLLEYWQHEFTEVVTSNESLIRAEPKQRLKLIIAMIEEYDLGRYDISFRAWARHDEMAAAVVREVTNARLEFMRVLFRELGFKGDELEMRARLFVCYHTWEKSTFDQLPKAKETRIRNQVIQLFCGDEPTATEGM